MQDRLSGDGWAARPWVMAALGATAGLLIHWLTDGAAGEGETLRFAAAAAVAAGAALFAFTFEPVRAGWAAIFAAVAGLVVGLVIYWNGAPGWNDSDVWRNVCVALAVAIAAPLFQTARDEGRAHFPYQAVHGHAWTNVVIWFAAWAFTGVTFLLALLLSALFELIGVNLLRDLLRDEWFGWMLGGTAFGAAIGLLRELDRIVALLQRVVVSVLAVLAPVLGAGLILFLVSLIFTGLEPLWEATKSTTPILLACVIGALILANAVIGNSDAEESRFAPLRYGAMALGVAMLPFAAIAAVSTGLRIQQYGLTPERLWALVFVIVACAYGLAYLVALARKRTDWAQAVRPANLKLAFGLCALALFLALPILSFNAISTRDQVARLTSGRVSPDKFDWAALRFDFGEAGRAALAKLARSGPDAVRRKAIAAQQSSNRWVAGEEVRAANAADSLGERLRILPRPVPIPRELAVRLAGYDACGIEGACVLVWQPGEPTAVVIRPNCTDRGCYPSVTRLSQRDGRWPQRPDVEASPAPRFTPGELTAGNIEVRTVERRQVFVGGKPLGEPFE